MAANNRANTNPSIGEIPFVHLSSPSFVVEPRGAMFSGPRNLVAAVHGPKVVRDGLGTNLLGWKIVETLPSQTRLRTCRPRC